MRKHSPKEADVHPAVIESTVLRIEGKVVSVWKRLVVNIGYRKVLKYSIFLQRELVFEKMHKCMDIK